MRKVLLIYLLTFLSFSGISQTIQINNTETGIQITSNESINSLSINGTDLTDSLFNNTLSISEEYSEFLFLQAEFGQEKVNRLYRIEEGEASQIPLWWSIIPPLIAIGMALIFKEVLISLFIGIFSGAWLLYGLNVKLLFAALGRTIDKFLLEAFTDGGHASVLLFSVLIGGLVAVVSKNGGMTGIVKALSRFAKTPRNTQFMTWVMGIAIFFDDYANTLIVGNTMRPVTDSQKISRAKLAYIVDSTAAPVASIAFITTWIGAELGYITDAIQNLNLDLTAYGVFLSSLQYSFYPILTLIFIFLLIRSKRDFGPMYHAELKARAATELEQVNDDLKDEAFEAKEGVKLDWKNAAIPILTIVVVTLFGLMKTGLESNPWESTKGFFTNLSAVIGASDAYLGLLWGSISGVLVGIIISVSRKLMGFKETMDSLMEGFKAMMPAVLILLLAWGLAGVTKELHTAEYLTSVFEGNIPVMWLPILTFVFAAIISFSTGSSWSTMAILYPIALPATVILGKSEGLELEEILPYLFNVTSVVLGGSVLGDHCSPISDTTVMSSLASQCNHIEHVRTQIPYALTVGGISILCGGVLAVLGVPWYINFSVGILLVVLVIRFVGKLLPSDQIAEEKG